MNDFSYEKKFAERTLRADEIEVRVQSCKATGCQLLLYIDSRAAMNILDELVGPMNWARDHKVIKNSVYCGLGIWDEAKHMWVFKWDAGAESAVEKEKGEASDSFKRAFINATGGVGRELYTAPFIWIPANLAGIKMDGQKAKTYDKFAVEQILYEGRKIVALSIVNVTQGKRCFVWDGRKKV
jgi:hypothetical protein